MPRSFALSKTFTVACLGLLGTVSFTIKKRVKEISIRKILGSPAESLVLLLSKDFVFLMVIASIISIQVIYRLFTQMLGHSQYYYSMRIGFVEIIVSLMIMLVLCLTTFCYKPLIRKTPIPLII